MNIPQPSSTGAMDRVQAALSIIRDSARELAARMYPVALLVPTNGIATVGISVPATTTLQSQQLQWPTDGIAVAIRATTADGLAASMAAMSLSVQVDGNKDLFAAATGGGTGFYPFSALVSNSYGCWSFRKRFVQAQYWTFGLQNLSSGTLVANVMFDYIDTRNPQIA
jgi:hypothetical protein